MTAIRIDAVSLLVDVDADVMVDALERELARGGLTLGLSTTAPRTSVAEWVGDGAPGAAPSWVDPADHLVAGFEATFGERAVTLRPAPRRATGPDLLALVLGQRGRFAMLRTACLRVHRRDARRPVTAPFRFDPPAPTEAEQALSGAIAAALAQPGGQER